MDAMELRDRCGGRTALVVGHPGHELRIHHWVETLQPRVAVLTDGSGRSNASRLASTQLLLNRTGAQTGALFGRYSDRQFYDALIERKTSLFLGIAAELADEFVTHDIRCVIGDAYEGYNPTHDVCRLIIGVATTLAQRRTGGPIESFAFPLAADPSANCSGSDSAKNKSSLELGNVAFDRKLDAARNYRELSGEFAAAVRRNGLAAFRTECLWRVNVRDGWDGPCECPPFYESYGERQVAAGHYQSVIRYEPHVRELAIACRELVEGAA